MDEVGVHLQPAFGKGAIFFRLVRFKLSWFQWFLEDRLSKAHYASGVFLAKSAMPSEGLVVSCLIAICRDYGLMMTDMIGGDRMSFKRSGQTELTLAVQVRH